MTPEAFNFNSYGMSRYLSGLLPGISYLSAVPTNTIYLEFYSHRMLPRSLRLRPQSEQARRMFPGSDKTRMPRCTSCICRAGRANLAPKPSTTCILH
jgi:hypothetical protein